MPNNATEVGTLPAGFRSWDSAGDISIVRAFFDQVNTPLEIFDPSDDDNFACIVGLMFTPLTPSVLTVKYGTAAEAEHPVNISGGIGLSIERTMLFPTYEKGAPLQASISAVNTTTNSEIVTFYCVEFKSAYFS